MDAISKWLVADYPVGQLMWIRYGVFAVFAWLVVGPPAACARRRARRDRGCKAAAPCWR